MTTLLQSHRKATRLSSANALRVVATNAAYGEICRCLVRELPATIRNRVKVSSFNSWEDIDLRETPQSRVDRTLLVCRLADIPEKILAGQLGRAERTHLVFLDDFPVEAISSRISRLNVRNPQRLHLAREAGLSAVAAIVKRAILGLIEGESRQGLADAWVEGECLVALSSQFDRLHVPLRDLHQFVGENLRDIQSFEIDEDGSYLYWPHADAHLGWEQLQGIVDPVALVAARQRSDAFNQRYGQAIRAFREERGLKQHEIAGIADRHLRRIERGQLAASSSALESLAKAHGMGLAAYLAELARRL